MVPGEDAWRGTNPDHERVLRTLNLLEDHTLQISNVRKFLTCQDPVSRLDKQPSEPSVASPDRIVSVARSTDLDRFVRFRKAGRRQHTNLQETQQKPRV